MTNSFLLEIAIEPISSGEAMVLPATINIGNFKESFFCPLSFWGRSDYLHQWNEGLTRLREGHKKSAIIAEMYDPDCANYINWWVLYLEQNIVFIQNHILFMSDIDGKFTRENMYDFTPERETETEDGERLSEWQTNLDAINGFLDKQAINNTN